MNKFLVCFIGKDVIKCKKKSHRNTSYDLIKETQPVFPSLIYLILLPFCAKWGKLYIFWITTSFILCLLSFVFVYFRHKKYGWNYSLKYATSINGLLLILLLYQVIALIMIHGNLIKNNANTMKLLNMVYFMLFIIFIILMSMFICAASINKPLIVAIALITLIFVIVYIKHESINIIATFLLLPVVDWIAEGEDEAKTAKEIQLITLINRLNSKSVIKLIANNPKLTKMLIGVFSLSWIIISEVTDFVDSYFLNRWLKEDYLVTRLYSFIIVILFCLILVFLCYLLFFRKSYKKLIGENRGTSRNSR